jgi:hypothetical protein
MKKAPIFSMFCIDYRFDALIANFYGGIEREYDYFACTVAGGILALGYKKYCENECKCTCKYDDKLCDPSNSSMKLLKKSLIENLTIALTLKPIEEVFLLNHQDCGAIKAFLSYSGYPKKLGENNPKEIKINQDLLTYAKKYMSKKFAGMKFTLGLVDINGTVATYDSSKKYWRIIYVGEFNIKEALWHGMKVGDKYKL